MGSVLEARPERSSTLLFSLASGRSKTRESSSQDRPKRSATKYPDFYFQQLMKMLSVAPSNVCWINQSANGWVGEGFEMWNEHYRPERALKELEESYMSAISAGAARADGS
jgi:hypothetical protein